jgi:hypothetical protein
MIDPYSPTGVQLLKAAPIAALSFAAAFFCLFRRARPLRVRVMVGLAVAFTLFNLGTGSILMGRFFATPSANPAILEIQGIVLRWSHPLLTSFSFALLLWAAFTTDEGK